MKTIQTTASVSSGRLVASVPIDIKAGDYPVVLVLEDNPVRKLNKNNLGDLLPVHEIGPWPGALAENRENWYGDEGR